jgi:2-methylisocitrate lyase-like PEP mutase family enzyme
MSQTDRAAVFRNLHQGPEVLVLANAWDGGSARLIASLGAAAIATTSSGVAWAHGYQDGDQLPVEIHAGTVRDIVRAVDVPVTVDAEGGYSDDLTAVGEAVRRLVDAGAVGINLEDGGGTPDLMCAKIEAVKRAAAGAGVDLFVNARTDVYLRQLAPPEERVAAALARGARYVAAGAEGLFVPGATDAEEIRALARGAGAPLNIMARPGLPSLAEMKALGVRRLSAGGAISQALWGRMRVLAAAFLAEGPTDALFQDAMTYPDLNALMAR